MLTLFNAQARRLQVSKYYVFHTSGAEAHFGRTTRGRRDAGAAGRSQV
jgi:hypothetical protein